MSGNAVRRRGDENRIGLEALFVVDFDGERGNERLPRESVTEGCCW